MHPALDNENVLVAWHQIWKLVTLALQFGPLFDEPPTDHRLDIARELSGLLDPADVGRALSLSRQRDWDPLAKLVNWLRRVAPSVCEQIRSSVDLRPLVARARELAQTMPHDLEMLFAMLVLDEVDGRAEPFATLLDALSHDVNVLSIRFAILAPSIALQILKRGGRLRWSLSGVRPRWQDSSGILDFLKKQHPDMLSTFLEQAIDEIADGLVFRNDNSTENSENFLDTVERTAPEVLPLVFAKIDRAAAMEHWPARLRSAKDSVKNTMLEILHRVSELPGPAQSLADELIQSH